MAPFDREGALKRAEKALRLGRIDAAIEEYQAHRPGPAARLEQRQRARRPVRPRRPARQGRRAVHRASPITSPTRASTRRPRRSTRKSSRSSPTDEYALAAFGRHRRQAGPARRRQDGLSDRGRPPAQARRHHAAPPRWPCASARSTPRTSTPATPPPRPRASSATARPRCASCARSPSVRGEGAPRAGALGLPRHPRTGAGGRGRARPGPRRQHRHRRVRQRARAGVVAGRARASSPRRSKPPASTPRRSRCWAHRRSRSDDVDARVQAGRAAHLAAGDTVAARALPDDRDAPATTPRCG